MRVGCVPYAKKRIKVGTIPGPCAGPGAGRPNVIYRAALSWRRCVGLWWSKVGGSQCRG